MHSVATTKNLFSQLKDLFYLHPNKDQSDLPFSSLTSKPILVSLIDFIETQRTLAAKLTEISREVSNYYKIRLYHILRDVSINFHLKHFSSLTVLQIFPQNQTCPPKLSFRKYLHP